MKTIKQLFFTLTAAFFTSFLVGCDADTQSANISPSPTGKAGSMARFATVGNMLYAINGQNIEVFDVQNPSQPASINEVAIGFGIETLFPQGDKLFVGSQNGLYIYDNSNPIQPRFLSMYAHVTACDPVVVEGDYAYVTLSTGRTCQNSFINALEIIDIRNLYSPVRVNSINLTNPKGLGIDENLLFICDGDAGLKVFDIGEESATTPRFIKAFPNVNAYDVIPENRNLILTGSTGIHQYSYDAAGNINYLSSIPVKK